MTDEEATQWELLMDRSFSRMLDSEPFRTVLRSVVLSVTVELEKAGRVELPKRLVASCATRGVYLRVDDHDQLVGSGKGKIDREIQAMVTLYKQDIIRYLKAERPQAVALSVLESPPPNGRK